MTAATVAALSPRPGDRCTQQGIATTNPITAKIVLAVLAALAESYLDNLSEESSKGKRARAQAGLPKGDGPYGYRNPAEGTERSGAGVNTALARQRGRDTELLLAATGRGALPTGYTVL